jgi:antitoxin component YwqK of YwqJK toxin-antitoxin module
MKTFAFLIISFFIVCCSSGNNGSQAKHKEYSYNELTVNLVRNTRVATFILEDKPISGTVTQDLNNGGKNIWEVEKGLAIKQTMYYPDGQIRRVLEMKNGVEHGSFLLFFPDGQKSQEQFYEDGKPIGIWNRWNAEGELVETIEH